jgi:hypothetical protein
VPNFPFATDVLLDESCWRPTSLIVSRADRMNRGTQRFMSTLPRVKTHVDNAFSKRGINSPAKLTQLVRRSD